MNIHIYNAWVVPYLYALWKNIMYFLACHARTASCQNPLEPSIRMLDLTLTCLKWFTIGEEVFVKTQVVLVSKVRGASFVCVWIRSECNHFDIIPTNKE